MDITKDKHYKTFDKISRYTTTPIAYNMLDKKYMSCKWNPVRKDIIFEWHTVEPGETLDYLALCFYGNPTYYWYIADFNDIFDPFYQPAAGDKIKIPSLSSLEFVY